MDENAAPRLSPVLVEDEDVRPARQNGTCFYCKQPLGQPHREDCPVPDRWVRVRVTMELDTLTPAYNSKHQAQFCWNEGTWCVGNMLDALMKATDSRYRAESRRDWVESGGDPARFDRDHAWIFDDNGEICEDTADDELDLCGFTRIDVIGPMDSPPVHGPNMSVWRPAKGRQFRLGFPNERPLPPLNEDEPEDFFGGWCGACLHVTVGSAQCEKCYHTDTTTMLYTRKRA